MGKEADGGEHSMNRENKTRPSVGALGRAVETGSAMQADTTSKPQFTPNVPGVQR